MSTMSKVALAIDKQDYPKLQYFIDNIFEAHEILDRETPDNTYRCIYWDDVCWCSTAAVTLQREIANIRHALIEICEDGDITQDILIEDDQGTDECFDEMLSWSGDICFWDDGWGNAYPLTPVSSGRYSHIYPISRNRVIQILVSYVENDLQATEDGYIYEALSGAGASNEEITALGLGYCIPDDEE